MWIGLHQFPSWLICFFTRINNVSTCEQWKFRSGYASAQCDQSSLSAYSMLLLWKLDRWLVYAEVPKQKFLPCRRWWKSIVYPSPLNIISDQFVTTDNLLYTNTRYNDKFVIMTFDCQEEVKKGHKLCKNIVFNTLKKHMFWIFVRIASVKRF